jgi:diguanylate cyclase (GGDEF)-like protein
MDIASILEFTAKGNAIVMHNGGDEFVILVVKGNYETSKKLAEDIKSIIDKKFDQVAKIKKRKIKVNISIGIATAQNNQISFKNLITKADADLLKNKKKKM